MQFHQIRIADSHPSGPVAEGQKGKRATGVARGGGEVGLAMARQARPSMMALKVGLGRMALPVLALSGW
jgi:hypothetical protein